MQAAIGISQLAKIETFISKRKMNFEYLKQRLQNIEGSTICEPTQNSDPSWFGFPITLNQDLNIEREDLLKFLNGRQVATRLIFAGNVTKQPAYSNVNFKVIGDLTFTDIVMKRTFWVGIYPGLTNDMLDYVADSIIEFVSGKAKL